MKVSKKDLEKLSAMYNYLFKSENSYVDLTFNDLEDLLEINKNEKHKHKQCLNFYWEKGKSYITLNSYNESYHNGDSYSDDYEHFKITKEVYDIMYKEIKSAVNKKIKKEVEEEELKKKRMEEEEKIEKIFQEKFKET